MRIILNRFEFGTGYTIGKLYVDDQYQCYTLEDKVQYPKVPKETAIPKGVYKVIVNFSNRFNREMPLLLNVPEFSGIRIHAGNTSKDTEGCILVGETWAGVGRIYNSQSAFGRLFCKIQNAISKGEEVTITITEGVTNNAS